MERKINTTIINLKLVKRREKELDSKCRKPPNLVIKEEVHLSKLHELEREIKVTLLYLLVLVDDRR